MPRSFDDLTQTLDLQRDIAADLHTLFDLDAAVAKALVANLAAIVGIQNGQPQTGQPSQQTKPKRESDNFDKVAGVYRKNGNAPLTKTQIMEASRVSKGALHALLYDAHPTDFVKKPNPDGGKQRVIVLSPAAWETAKRREGAA